MTVQWQGGKNFLIKTKTLSAKIGEKNQLGELAIECPGEYEVLGVQMEIVDGMTEVFAEGICLGLMPKAKLLSDTELEKLNGIDILLIGVGGGEFTETKAALQVVAQIEPSIVIPIYEKEEALAEFVKEEGGSQEGKDELKISKLDLNLEERQLVVLNARR